MHTNTYTNMYTCTRTHTHMHKTYTYDLYLSFHMADISRYNMSASNISLTDANTIQHIRWITTFNISNKLYHAVTKKI